MTDPTPTPTTAPPAPAPAPPTNTPPTPPAPAADDKPLGPAGERALAAEREARKALEKQVAELAPLANLAKALGGGDPTKGKDELASLAERQAATEATLAEERAARWRAEIGHEKGLTPAQAGRLIGKSREEMAADADALVALFPNAAGQPGTPRTPAPDPSQGARGGAAAPDLDAQIAEAQKNQNWGLVVSLQRQKFDKSK